MKTDEQIRTAVMRRVYAIYLARELKKPAPRVILLAALGTALISSVSIGNIAANVWQVRGIGQLAFFALSAFAATTPFVQAVTVAMVGVLSWFTVDGFKRAQVALHLGKAEPAPVN